MPIAPLHATRDADPPDDGAAPRVEGGPHVVPLQPRDRRIAAGVAGALVFHVFAAIAFAIFWRDTARDLTTPEGIAVEIVDEMPGEGKKAGGETQPKPADKPAEKPAAAPSPAPAPPEQKADALRDALAMPAAPTPAPTAEPTPAPTPTPTPEPTPQPTPEAKSTAPTPSPLAEPPPEPKAAATQAAPEDKPNAAAEALKTEPPEAEAPPPPAPDVLTVPQADTAVPTPSQAPDKTEPAKTAEATEDRSRQAAASLSAALPTSSLAMPSTFRAMLSSQGTSTSQQYKGVVFGSLARATQAVSEEARRRRLQGQVVVSIVLDTGGGIASAAILQSSGSAEVDALALDLVHRAAPFPAPPAGSPRSFTPVITIGEE